MKLSHLFLATLIIPSVIFSQDYYKQGQFLVKGHVKNAKEQFVEYGLTTFFNPLSGSIVIKSDGSFEQMIPIQHSQNLYLQLDNELLLFRVFDKDTLNLDWDDSDFKNSFSVNGKNDLRTKELQVQRKFSSFFYSYINLIASLDENSKTVTAEKKFERINDLFNQQVKTVLDSSGFFSIALNYLINDLYCRYSQALWRFHLIPRFQLTVNLDSSISYPNFDIKSGYFNYTILNEDWFWNIPEYRSFLFDYIRFYKPFDGSRSSTNAVQKPFNPTLDEYHAAQAHIDLLSVKDWFITQSIMLGFEHYSFPDVEKVCEQFIPNCNTPYLKDTLQKFYTAIKRLRPGSVAPEFKLKDDRGKTVSLNDFKGKVVYIDFWGVGCGPCIYDIEKHVPKLHSKYKDSNVVFVNVCVDAKENEWKAALAKYKLDGVNLIAEGWTSHPVCKAYNINGIPHYILVDRNGRISDNNAPRASELNINSNNNEIDVLLR